MNIVLVNLYDSFPNESYAKGRYTNLSQHLSNVGHNVLWISSQFHHGSKKDRNPGNYVSTNENLKIIPLSSLRYNKNIGFRRLISDYRLSKLIILELDKIHKENKIDIIIVSMGPIFTPSAVVSFAKKNKIKSIIDIQDLYPEAMYAVIPKKIRFLAKILLLPLNLKIKRLILNSDGVSSLSKNRLKEAFDKFNFDLKKPSRAIYLNFKGIPSVIDKKKNPKTQTLKIAYIGTIGSFYDFDTVFNSFYEIAKTSIKIELHIIGSGPKLNYYKNIVKKLELNNVFFYGYMPFDKSINLIRSCDIGIVPILKTWPSCIPNKPIDYLGLGLPILNSVQGELSSLVTDFDIGYNYIAENCDSLTLTIKQVNNDLNDGVLADKGINGYNLVKERFTIEKIMLQFESFINEVIDS